MTPIEAPRLILRPPELADYDDFHALTVPDAMRRFLGPDPPSREASFRRFTGTAGGWSLVGYSSFMVFDRASGTLAGSCGLFHLPRELGPDFDGHPEAGWVIAEPFWGRGYAVEAMAAALAWFESTHGLRRTVCMISPGNDASERVADRLGYRLLRAANYKAEQVQLYARS